MERRFFFGALAGLVGLFTIAANEPKKPSPKTKWDVDAREGHYGILRDANGLDIAPPRTKGNSVAAILLTGQVLMISTATGEICYWIENHPAPLSFHPHGN